MGSLVRALFRSAAAVLVLAATSGCSATNRQVITTPDRPAAAPTEVSGTDEEPLPPVLRRLGLSAAQRAEFRQLRGEMKSRLEPVGDAGGEYGLALAKVARQCDSDGRALEDAASWLVVVGEDVRGSVLDAIDRAHRILTPAQRRALAKRLLGREEDRDSEQNTDEGARSIGGELDLSIGQLVSLLVRAQLLRSALDERLGPWRGQYRKALRAFPEDDFSIRDHAIAEVPAAAIATRAVRDGVRMLLPILEPEQCVTLAEFIEEAVRKERDDER